MFTPNDLAPKEPRTEESYTCLSQECECGTPIMYLIEPEYNIEIGIERGLPKELLFIPEGLDFQVQPTSEDNFWRLNPLASGKSLVVRCSCGEAHPSIICKGGEELLVVTAYATPVEVPIPRSKVRAITEPKEDWNVEGP